MHKRLKEYGWRTRRAVTSNCCAAVFSPAPKKNLICPSPPNNTNKFLHCCVFGYCRCAQRTPTLLLRHSSTLAHNYHCSTFPLPACVHTSSLNHHHHHHPCGGAADCFPLPNEGFAFTKSICGQKKPNTLPTCSQPTTTLPTVFFVRKKKPAEKAPPPSTHTTSFVFCCCCCCCCADLHHHHRRRRRRRRTGLAARARTSLPKQNCSTFVFRSLSPTHLFLPPKNAPQICAFFKNCRHRDLYIRRANLCYISSLTILFCAADVLCAPPPAAAARHVPPLKKS